MRALITGIIGAAASSAAWLAFEHSQQQSYGWLVLLIGIVTGVCVHSGATGPGGGTLRGALAVLLTLAGIVGGQKAYATWMQKQSTANEAAAVEMIKSDAAEGDDEADDEAAETAVAEQPKLELPEEMTGAGKGGYSKSAMKKNFSEWDMVWMSLAALAAYITGKGGEQKAPATATEQDQPSEPAEDQGSTEGSAE